MKRIILAVALVVVLIAGGLGGAVVANTPPDDSPKGMWESINNGISDILMYLEIMENDLAVMISDGFSATMMYLEIMENDLGSMISQGFSDIMTYLGIIEGKVDAIDNDLGIIEGKVDAIDNDLGMIEGKVDDLQADVSAIKDNSVKIETEIIDIFPGETYNQFVRYFPPAHISITLNVHNPGNNIELWVHTQKDGYLISDPYADISAQGLYTYEFDATAFTIDTEDDGSAAALCVYTATYAITD